MEDQIEDDDNFYDNDDDYDRDDDDYDNDDDDRDDDDYDYDDDEIGNSDLINPSLLTTKKRLSVFKKSGSLSHLKFLSHIKKSGVAPKTSGACTYGVIDIHGYAIQQHSACHSSLSDQYVCNRLGYYNLVYTRDPNNTAVPRELLDYIYDKKLSPWRQVLARGFCVKHYDNYSAFTTTNFDVSSQLLCSFFKSTRIYTEQNSHTITLDYLLSRGVHPGVALFLAQCYATSTSTHYLTYDPDWHGSFLKHDTCSQAIVNFINGEPDDSQVPYHQRISYNGVDSIWGIGYGADRYDKFLVAKYPDLYPKHDTKISRFGSNVQVSGLTLDDLYLIAIQETARCLVG